MDHDRKEIKSTCANDDDAQLQVDVNFVLFGVRLPSFKHFRQKVQKALQTDGIKTKPAPDE